MKFKEFCDEFVSCELCPLNNIAVEDCEELFDKRDEDGNITIEININEYC